MPLRLKILTWVIVAFFAANIAALLLALLALCGFFPLIPRETMGLLCLFLSGLWAGMAWRQVIFNAARECEAHLRKEQD